MEQETKQLVLEVSLGIGVYTAAAMVLAYIFYPRPPVFTGLLVGTATALVMFFSMAAVLDRSLKSPDPNAVQKSTIISTVVRYLVVIGVFAAVIVWFSNKVNIISTLVGVLSLKAGAYLQPVMHKFLRGEEEEEFGNENRS